MSESNMTLTRPSETVWQINLHAPPDNRLTIEFLTEFGAMLDTVEGEWRKSGGGEDDKGKNKGAGALVLTSSLPKFFSNGLSPSVLGIPNFFESVYDPVMYRLLTFPLVTVAAINGHAFAGGMIMAFCCDYRVITNGKAMMSMNEIFLGLPMPNSFATWLRMRLPFQALRETMLGKRWFQKEMLANGMVDEVVDQDQVVPKAIEIGTREGSKIGGGSWGAIKDGMYHDVIDASRSQRQISKPFMESDAFWARMERQNEAAKYKAKL